MSNFKKGDRVRVTFEGEVAVAQSAIDGAIVVRTNVGPMPNTWVRPEFVEKIEPPVVVFGPGDVVKGKGSGRKIAIADDGWLDLSTGRFTRWSRPSGNFTSENYERIELVEVPF